MSTVATTSPRRRSGRLGDYVLYAVASLAALGTIAILVAIAWELVDGARQAFDRFGLSFVWSRAWDPVKNQFGALDLLYGTAITSLFAILVATPLAVAIALYLTELAPRGVRDVIGALVEMLAAIPSVILGLWGIIVLGPFVAGTLAPFLNKYFGWIPFFSGEPAASGASYMSAVLVLTIMVLPIVASVSRELFLSVPREMKEGALAMGMTRWEMVRGVVLPHSGAGIGAAVILGLGRAIGEAIAVTQVIGGSLGIHISLFATGDTLASRIASQYAGASSFLQTSSIIYLAGILLVMSLIANFAAQLIVRRFDIHRAAA